MDGSMKKRVNEILDESDPKRRLALSRKLRVEVWDLLDHENLARLEGWGLDGRPEVRAVREVK